MRALTSWATCGYRPTDQEEEEEEEEEKPVVVQQPGRYASMGLDARRREEIGRQCKQIIDRGRLAFVSGWPLDARLVVYVETRISPENVLLIAS